MSASTGDERTDTAILARYYHHYYSNSDTRGQQDYSHRSHDYNTDRRQQAPHQHLHHANTTTTTTTTTMSLSDEQRVAGSEDRGDVKRKCDDFPSLYSLDAAHASATRGLPDPSGKCLIYPTPLVSVRFVLSTPPLG